MSLLPSKMAINDPPFALGEKVRPKEAEPKACPYAAFEQAGHTYPEVVAVSGLLLDKIERGEEVELPTEADLEGWIPHDGGPCPVDGGAWVYVRDGGATSLNAHPAGSWGVAEWKHFTHYKLATPPEAPKEVATHPTAFLDMVISEYGPYDLGEYVRSRGDCSCHISPPCSLCSSPIEYGDAEDWLDSEPELSPLHQQLLNQCLGLPVEWDKVPVGSRVWVRDSAQEAWLAAKWREVKDGTYRTACIFANKHTSVFAWKQCQLHIEGVAP